MYNPGSIVRGVKIELIQSSIEVDDDGGDDGDDGDDGDEDGDGDDDGDANGTLIPCSFMNSTIISCIEVVDDKDVSVGGFVTDSAVVLVPANLIVSGVVMSNNSLNIFS